MDIIEGNKLIAEFMGMKITNIDGIDVWVITDIHNGLMEETNSCFHISWDWICPVFNKICNLGYTVQWTITDGSTCRIWPHLKTVPSCGVIVTDRPFTAVVQFIQWYNTQSNPTTHA